MANRTATPAHARAAAPAPRRRRADRERRDSHQMIGAKTMQKAERERGSEEDDRIAHQRTVNVQVTGTFLGT